MLIKQKTVKTFSFKIKDLAVKLKLLYKADEVRMAGLRQRASELVETI